MDAGELQPPITPGLDREWTGDRVAGLFRHLDGELADAVALRRKLHADPRLSGDEHDTTTELLAALEVDVEPLTFGGAVVRIGPPNTPAVAVRAEMDALPVLESTDVPWRSENGAMHACGHDVHMAAAVALARTVRAAGSPLALVLVLQPREETYPSGAEDIATSGALSGHDIRAFVGAHVQPRLPGGSFAGTPGPVNAASDQFRVTVNGRPGHAAYPHLTADPVVAAADLIGTLQHLISRQVDPTNPTVLTIGSIEGGNSPNVVPARVRMRGTLRTFDEGDRMRLHASIETTAKAIANVHGCEAVVETVLGAPVLVNDLELTTTVATWVEHAGLHPAPPLRSCGADDFSFFCPLFPSVMLFVGVGSGAADAPGLHHPDFLPPEDAVGHVARSMLAAYLGACANVAGLPLPER